MYTNYLSKENIQADIYYQKLMIEVVNSIYNIVTVQ